MVLRERLLVRRTTGSASLAVDPEGAANGPSSPSSRPSQSSSPSLLTSQRFLRLVRCSVAAAAFASPAVA